MVSDSGIIIELVDQPQAHLLEGTTLDFHKNVDAFLALMAKELGRQPHYIEITAFSGRAPLFPFPDDKHWKASFDLANQVRARLESLGLPSIYIRNVAGSCEPRYFETVKDYPPGPWIKILLQP